MMDGMRLLWTLAYVSGLVVRAASLVKDAHIEGGIKGRILILLILNIKETAHSKGCGCDSVVGSERL